MNADGGKKKLASAVTIYDSEFYMNISFLHHGNLKVKDLVSFYISKNYKPL